MTNIVRLPISYFGQFNQGRPIFSGSVYVGEPDLDPEVEANRKALTLTQEDGTEVQILPPAQPLLISSGGYFTYAGSPVLSIKTEGNYSMKVLDKSNSQVYYFPSVLDGEPITITDGIIVKNFATLNDAVNSASLVDGDALNIAERTTGNGGGAMWDVVLASTVTPNTYDIVQCVGSPTLALVLRDLEEFNVKQFGALIDGVTDDSGAFDAARNRSPSKSIEVPPGTAVVTSGTFTSNLFHSFGVFTSNNEKLIVENKMSRRDDLTVTVGSGGDFPTINDALNHLSTSYPSYVNPRPNVVINLLTGFVMEEQVLVWGIDLSWIRITGDDVETVIDSSFLTESPSTGVENYSATYKPAFAVYAGGTGPKIDQMFDMGFTVQDPMQQNVGVLCYGPGSSIEVGRSAGVRRCGWYGVLANLGARVLAYESNFTNSYGRGMFANEGSLISARECDASGAASTAFHSSDGSQINAELAIGSNSLIGFSANNGGRINCRSGTATTCQEGASAQNGGYIAAEEVNVSGAVGGNGLGIRAFNGGWVDAHDADASGCENFGISCERGSHINAQDVNAQKGGAPDPNDVRITNGSTVNFDGGTGGTSETVNTLTPNGIIYQ